MKRVFIGVLILFQSSYVSAQELEYLNTYEYPVENISEYSYSYVKMTSAKGNIIQTQIFNLDTIKVYHATTLLNDKGEASSERVLKCYEDGVMKSNLRQNFDEKTSEEKHYYSSGELKLEVTKKKGKVISENYFDREGNLAIAEDFQEPSPKDGAKGWRNYIADNLNYPETARSSGIEGTVIIGFELDENGQILNPMVVNPENVDFSLANEALRAVLDYPYSWSPKIENGQAIPTRTKLPITFKSEM